MASWLDRFDEVWAEAENLPSPYALEQARVQEYQRIAAEQVLELANINHDVLEMLRRQGTIQNYRYDSQRKVIYIQPVHAVDYVEMSFVTSPADPAILPEPSDGVDQHG